MVQRNHVLTACYHKIKYLQDRLNFYNAVQAGREKMIADEFSRVLNSRDKALQEAQEKIQHVEGALRVKTSQWQELHQNFEQLQQQLQRAERNLKSLNNSMQLLQEKLMLEKFTNRALHTEVKRLQCRIDGKPEPKLTEELKTYQMIEDVKHAEEVYGEDSAECKLRRKKLDRRLEELADDAKREAAAEHDKQRAHRQAQFKETRDARLKKNDAS